MVFRGSCGVHETTLFNPETCLEFVSYDSQPWTCMSKRKSLKCNNLNSYLLDNMIWQHGSVVSNGASQQETVFNPQFG